MATQKTSSRKSTTASRSGGGGSAGRSKSGGRSGSSAGKGRGKSSGAGSEVTTDREQIRQWAEARGAQPACVRGTGGRGDVGMIRLDFPGYSGADKLQPISWDEWFEQFDENNLALLYQEKTADGQTSNFNKLVSRGGGRSGGSRKGAAGSRSRSAGSSSHGRGAASKTTKGASGLKSGGGGKGWSERTTTKARAGRGR